MVRKPNKAIVRIAAGAERDLAGIWRRRLAQRGAEGPDGADALLDRIVARIESLADHPLRGSAPPELEALGIRSYRQTSHPPFRIIYLPQERDNGMAVSIIVIADARRDFRVLLEERLLREQKMSESGAPAVHSEIYNSECARPGGLPG